MNFNFKNIRQEEESPAAEPENPMEKMMSGWMFDKKFIEQRKVFLWGPVDDKSAKEITDRLLYLEAINPGKDITFYINSPGGVVTSGMVIYDTMKMISSEVSTVCMGMAASMGSILLSGGQKGKRFIFPHGEVMIHQPSGGAHGQATDIQIQATEILKMKASLNKILAANTGKSVKEIEAATERDNFLSAQESKDYGLVDIVL